jgi:NAD(P)-dependent dehydrogenase (short-subunit alcohol dehydrogenase family)
VPGEFEGRVALVTGAGSGIGKASARLFAARGARVAVCDVDSRAGEEAAASIRQEGGTAVFMEADVSKPEQVESLIAGIVARYGRLDFAHNNAGIGPDGTRIPAFDIVDTPVDLWERYMAINLTGVFLCMKFEMRQMIAQGKGSIVNTSSVGAFKAVPGRAAYDATKTGLFGLTKAAALEGAARGIRVNTICPGPTGGTQLMDNLMRTAPETKEKLRAIVPLQRVAEPEEIAEVAVWFCSDAASFVTGQILPVDGGMTAM